MKISVIIPTFNRAELLRNALQSLVDADISPALRREISVIDNNSTDETKQVIAEFELIFKELKIEYRADFEPNQGKSFAVNRGILASNAELISILDDDMQIAKDWFLQVEKVFAERWDELDFIGGKVLPIWKGEAPQKIIPAMQSAIAIGDHGEIEWEFGADTPILSGGHAVIKREVFNEIGLYPTELGPKGGNLIGCEDDIFYEKLLKTNKKGIYFPPLHFFHFVPLHRLSKSYFRQWCFGVGMSWQLMDVYYQYFKEIKLLSVPRYMYRELVWSMVDKLRAVVAQDEDKSLDAEKRILVFSGFFYAGNIKNTRFNLPLKWLFSLRQKTYKR